MLYTIGNAYMALKFKEVHDNCGNREKADKKHTVISSTLLKVDMR
jgi:hypothetical protein